MKPNENTMNNFNSVVIPGETSPVEDLRQEVARAKRSPERCGLFAVKSANDWIEDAILLPDPEVFYHGLIVQYEITALFATTGAGKTAFAVQIAETIAQTNKILYVDLELSSKQFQLRYSDKESGEVHVFPPGFMRAEIAPDLITRENLEQEILDSIEEAAKRGTEFFVLDNITFACNDSEKGATAGAFMMKLIRLKKLYRLTLICIAHTPKIRGYEPLTSNDIKLMNFFDECIAIGRSARDGNLRYVKQVKTRSLATTYDAENVIIYELVRIDGCLHFDFRGYGKELEHLKKGNPAEDMDEINAVLRLQAEGHSQREIADILEISLGKVQRRLKKAKDNNITLSSGESSSVSPVSGAIQPIQDSPVQQQITLNLNDNEI